MPEYPDITVYLECLEAKVVGEVLDEVRIANPFLLRSVEPKLEEASGKRVTGLSRIGKRIVFALESELFLVLHLMIAGRLAWKKRGAKLGGKATLAAFDFGEHSLVLTEAGSHRRASLHLVRGEEALAAFDPGGLDVFAIELEAFTGALTRERHTLKRALTDPHFLSGIGNAYSDEILHAARLSPVQLTTNLSPEEWARLFDATRAVLTDWTDRLRREAAASGWPKKVTAFHPEMAAHGRFGEPCPDCGTKVQRILYATRETNYCPRCQTGGKLLADRVLSRLLKSDWPRTLEELEGRK